MTVLAINSPPHYDELIQGVEAAEISYSAAQPIAGGPYDIVHVFCADKRALVAVVESALAMVTKGGMLWISWPKKSSREFVDLTEDGVRDAVLPHGWVDVKVCAVDEDWSALKFLERRT